MEVTAALVKELRDKTGAGILDAKKALVEAGGDMEKAMEVLRQKGIASAEKKMGRIAAEGRISSYVNNGVGAMIEVNCETDFVAKNADFIALVDDLAKIVADNNPKDVDALNAISVNGTTVADIIKEKIATIGEKITIRRFIRREGKLQTYVHNAKIGVLMLSDSDDDRLTKDVCLHITSIAPEFVSRDCIPQSVIEEETRIEMGKEDLQKKPEAIRAKIVEGRIAKLMASRCLLEQSFFKDAEKTVEQYIDGRMKVLSFDRFVLGEGLEKRQENFAEEVMSQMKG